jgi:hypothetical protein
MRATWRYLKLLYSRGFALFVLAPVIVAIVAVPEFIQHIAEIRLGMFDDIETARAMANGAERWAFGYAKLAGLAVGMLAAARFWGTRERGGRWWSLRGVAWWPLILSLAIFLLAPVLPDLVRAWIPGWLHLVTYWGLSLAVLPLLIAVLAALFGDRRVGPFANYWRDWRWVPLLLILLVAAYLPTMAAHYGLHRLALGAPKLAVWPLMALDALVVALIASLVGAALHLSYAAARGDHHADGAQA